MNATNEVNYKFYSTQFKEDEDLYQYWKNNFTTSQEKFDFLSGEWLSHCPNYCKEEESWEKVFNITLEALKSKDKSFYEIIKSNKKADDIVKSLSKNYHSENITNNGESHHRNDVFKSLYFSGVDKTMFNLENKNEKKGYDFIINMCSSYVLENNSDYLLNLAINNKDCFSSEFFSDIITDIFKKTHISKIKNFKKIECLGSFIETCFYSGYDFLSHIPKEILEKEGEYLQDKLDYLNGTGELVLRINCNFAQFIAIRSLNLNNIDNLNTIFKNLPSDLLHKDMALEDDEKSLYLFDLMLNKGLILLKQEEPLLIDSFFKPLKKEFPYLNGMSNSVLCLVNYLKDDEKKLQKESYKENALSVVFDYFKEDILLNKSNEINLTHPIFISYLIQKEMKKHTNKDNKIKSQTFKI